MRGLWWVFAGVTAVWAGVAMAAPPEVSPRPLPRPYGSTEPLVTASVATQGSLSLLPRMRPLPRPSAPTVAAFAALPVPTPVTGGLRHSPVPPARPGGFASVVKAAAVYAPVSPGAGAPSKKGAVCGDPAIKGQTLAPVIGRIQGCGIAAPVKVTEVAGVRLSQAATLDCAAAQALKSWVEDGLKPAFGRSGGGVAGLQVAAHYSCRTRNNVPGAKLSQHSKGLAIDISAVTLANGQSVKVLGEFGKGKLGKKLKTAYRAACGTFGTTLGPGSDRYHNDHMHLDVVRYRSGAYCR